VNVGNAETELLTGKCWSLCPAKRGGLHTNQTNDVMYGGVGWCAATISPTRHAMDAEQTWHLLLGRGATGAIATQ